MKRCALVSLALIAACGSEKSDQKDPATKTGSGSGSGQVAPSDGDAFIAIAQADLKAVTGTAGAVSYSIDLPEAAVAGTGDATGTYTFKDSALRLGIVSRAEPIAADELAKKKELPAEQKATHLLMRADQTSTDSYEVVVKAKKDTSFTFERCRNVSGGSVCCVTSLTIEKGFSVEYGAEWSAEVCRSLTVGGEAHPAPRPRPKKPVR